MAPTSADIDRLWMDGRRTETDRYRSIGSREVGRYVGSKAGGWVDEWVDKKVYRQTGRQRQTNK